MLFWAESTTKESRSQNWLRENSKSVSDKSGSKWFHVWESEKTYQESITSDSHLLPKQKTTKNCIGWTVNYFELCSSTAFTHTHTHLCDISFVMFYWWDSDRHEWYCVLDAMLCLQTFQYIIKINNVVFTCTGTIHSRNNCKLGSTYTGKNRQVINLLQVI